jgi:RND family efflux transporter MFP subunit
LVVVVIAGVLAGEMRSRVKAATNLRAVTSQMAVHSVSVVLPKRTVPAQEIVLPGNIQPYISSPTYARTDGYLKKWYFDIGAHVKKGDLLAIIQTPEVDEQLSQARSTLATAQANLELAQVTKDRYASLLKKHAVSQQDVDNAAGTYAANKAIVDADTANARHYAALVSFEKVYARFYGVITARNTDIGDLINSGSNTVPRTDLFDIAQTRTLRVYVNVPEEYSQAVKPGKTAADIILSEFPGKRFPGRLVRTSDAINATTRTLLTEVDVDNPGGTLFSGSYTEVHLKVPAQNTTSLLPVSALIFRGEKLQVGVVKNGHAVVTDVTPGHDFGDQIEIIAGLAPNDKVIVNPSDSLVSGQRVNVVQAALPGDSQ